MNLYFTETNKIEGLPKAWLSLLQNSKISETEQNTNPKAVVDALKYYCQTIKKPNQNKYLVTQDTLDDIRDIEADSWNKRTSSEDDSLKSSSREDLLSLEDNLNYYDDTTIDRGGESKHVRLVGDCQKINDASFRTNDDLLTHQHNLNNNNNNIRSSKENIYDVVKNVPAMTVKIDEHAQQSSNNNIYANINHNQNNHQTYLIQTSNNNQSRQAPEPQPRRRNKKINSPETEQQLIETLKSIVNPANPKPRFQFMKVIGEGASGKVFLAIDQTNQTKVAIKTMDLKSQPKKDLIIIEIMIMKENTHPNLVNYKDSVSSVFTCPKWIVINE